MRWWRGSASAIRLRSSRTSMSSSPAAPNRTVKPPSTGCALVAQYDPRPIAQRTKVPVYAITGFVDPIVPWVLVRPWLAASLPRSARLPDQLARRPHGARHRRRCRGGPGRALDRPEPIRAATGVSGSGTAKREGAGPLARWNSGGAILLEAGARVQQIHLRQGPWTVDLRTPPGPEGSNGSLLDICRGHPGL